MSRYVAVTTAATANTTSTSLTFNTPANRVGYGLVAVALSKNDQTPLGAPSGWFTAGFITNSTSPGSVTEVWYKFAQLNEPSTHTSTWTPGKGVAIICVSFEDVDSIDSEFSSIGSTTTVSTLTLPEITLDRAGQLIASMTRSNNGSTFTSPSGMTERADFNSNGAALCLALSTNTQASGATGTKTYTISAGSNRVTAVMLALLNGNRPITLATYKPTVAQVLNNPRSLSNQSTLRSRSNQVLSNPRSLQFSTRLSPLVAQSIQTTKRPQIQTRLDPQIDQIVQSPESLQLALVQKYSISQTVELAKLKIIGTPTNSGNGTGSTSHTFSRPTNPLLPGDIVTALYTQRGQTTEPSPPTGWLSGGFVSNSNTPGGGSGIWYKKFTQSDIDSDPGSYTASFTTRFIVTSTQIIRGAQGLSSFSTDSSNGTPRSTLTYPAITAIKKALALAFMGRNDTDSDPETAWTQPTDFIELVEYNDFTNERASLGSSYKYFNPESTGNITYTYSFTSGRLSGGFVLFYESDSNSLTTTATAKLTTNQTVQNTNLIRTQTTFQSSTQTQLSPSPKPLEASTQLIPQTNQALNNPSTLQFSPLQTAQISQSINTPSILNQQLKTTILAQQSFTVIQDAIAIQFSTQIKPQSQQTVIVQKTPQQSITVQTQNSQSVRNATQILHSAQINQNVLVNVQNTSRLNQTVQINQNVLVNVLNPSTPRSTTTLTPLVDQNIITSQPHPDITISQTTIAQIHQKIQSPQALYISTYAKPQISQVIQGTLIRPKFSMGVPHDFTITKLRVTFRLTSEDF
jgi:hypothetical protein